MWRSLQKLRKPSRTEWENHSDQYEPFLCISSLGGCVIGKMCVDDSRGGLCVLGVNVWWVSDLRCVLFRQTYVVNIPPRPVRNLHLRESGQSSYIHLEMFLQPWRREREAVRLYFSVRVLNSSVYKYYRNPFSGVSVNSERVLVCLLYCDFLCIYQVNEHGPGKLLVCVRMCAYACRLVHSLTTPVHSALVRSRWQMNKNNTSALGRNMWPANEEVYRTKYMRTM